MKSKIIVALFCVLISGILPATAQTKNKKYYLNPKDTMEMKYETFDWDFYQKNKDKDNNIHFENTKEDGTKVLIFGGSPSGFAATISKPPYFFVEAKEFFFNGNLKQKGILLGRCKIGKWMECDTEGNCKIEDYEQNRGNFPYAGVLQSMEKKKFIDLKTGKGHEDLRISYSYENKQWGISFFCKEDGVTYGFILDGDSGKLLSQNQEVHP